MLRQKRSHHPTSRLILLGARNQLMSGLGNKRVTLCLSKWKGAEPGRGLRHGQRGARGSQRGLIPSQSITSASAQENTHPEKQHALTTGPDLFVPGSSGFIQQTGQKFGRKSAKA